MNGDPLRGHVLFHEFGQQYDQGELLRRIAEQAVQIPDSMRDTKFGVDQWKRIIYHTLFIKPGLLDSNGSWDMVATNHVEDTYEARLVSSTLGQFRTYRVPEKFGIGIDAFLNLPKWLSDTILNDARLQHRQELHQIAKTEDDINREEERRNKERQR